MFFSPTTGQRQCQLWSRFGDLAFKSIPFLTSQELLRPVLKAGAAVEDRWQQRGFHISTCFITNVGSQILNHPQLSALLGAKGIHNTEMLINPNRWWCITVDPRLEMRWTWGTHETSMELHVYYIGQSIMIADFAWVVLVWDFLLLDAGGAAIETVRGTNKLHF